MNKLRLLFNKLFAPKPVVLSDVVVQKEVTLEPLVKTKEPLMDFLPSKNSTVDGDVKISIFTTTTFGTPKLIIDTLVKVLGVPIEQLAFSDFEKLNKLKKDIFMTTRKSYLAIYQDKVNGEYRILLGCRAQTIGESLCFSFISGVKIDYHTAYDSDMCVVTPNLN